MKNIMISLMLATSTCLAMMGSANAAFNDISKHTVQTQHHKDVMNANKNKSSTHKNNKQQPKAKVSQKTNHTNSKNQHVKAKTVTAKKSIAQHSNKSKKVTPEHNAKDRQHDKDHRF